MKSLLQWSAFTVLCAGSAVALAGPYDTWEPQRAGRWEVALQARYQDYDTLEFSDAITLDPDPSWGAGVSFGYNFDQYLNISLEIFGDEADYQGGVDTGGGRIGRVDGSLDNSTGQLNVTYHWFDSAVTPFIAAGLGWTYIDSHIIKNYSGYECWYHPWYGYACGDTFNTYDDTTFSYNAALGLRWDISEQFFLRGSVGREWVYLDDTSTHPTIDFGKLEVGMMF